MLANTARSRRIHIVWSVLVTTALFVVPAGVTLFLTGCSGPSAAAGSVAADQLTAEKTVTSGLPSLEGVIARYVRAVGGAEAVAGLRTRAAEMRCVTDLPSRTPPVYEVDSLSVHSVSSGEFLIVHSTERGVMMEGFDGDERWKMDFDGSVLSYHAYGDRDRWMTDPQFPIRLTFYFPDMRLLGVDYWDGGPLYIVDIDGDESHRLGFDVGTGLLVRLGYHREFKDYREVDGVLIPHEVVYGRKGGSSTFFIDSIQHNVPVDRAMFSMAK
jgi:hypothetical protein